MQQAQDQAWIELLRTLATTAFGAVLGWWFGRAGARHAEHLRQENIERERERTALIAMGRQLDRTAREVRSWAAIVGGEHGGDVAGKALERADSWWPPIHQALGTFEDEWKHSWQFDVGDRSVSVYMMIVGGGLSANIAFTDHRQDFPNKLGELSTDIKKLEEALAAAASAYGREMPVMTKRQELLWRFRRRFRGRERPKD